MPKYGTSKQSDCEGGKRPVPTVAEALQEEPVTTAKRTLLYLVCECEYLISRIIKLLLVLLKRAYFPSIAVSHKCFMVSGILFSSEPTCLTFLLAMPGGEGASALLNSSADTSNVRSALFALPPPPPLDIHDSNAAEKWKQFEQAWKNYSIAIKLHQEPEAIQVDTLLTIVGAEARKVFATFSDWPNDTDCLDIAWLLSNARTCTLGLEGSYHVLLPNGRLCTSELHCFEDELSDEVFGVEEISAVTLDDSQLVTLKLESGNYLRFQPDTGAQCNVIPVHLYKKATKDVDLCNVTSVNTAIISYGGTSIPIPGKVRLHVWHGDFRCLLDCNLVDSKTVRSILGRKA